MERSFASRTLIPHFIETFTEAGWFAIMGIVRLTKQLLLLAGFGAFWGLVANYLFYLQVFEDLFYVSPSWQRVAYHVLLIPQYGALFIRSVIESVFSPGAPRGVDVVWVGSEGRGREEFVVALLVGSLIGLIISYVVDHLRGELGVKPSKPFNPDA